MRAAKTAIFISGMPCLWFGIALTRKSFRTTGVLAAFIALPLFLEFHGSSLGFGDAIVPSGSGQTFPVSVLVVIIFAGALALRILMRDITLRRSALNMPITLLIFFNLFALLIGFFQGIRIENLLFFLQTILPMAGFFLALNLMPTVASVGKVFQVLVWVIGSFALSLLAFTVVSKGIIATMAGAPSGYLWIFPLYTLFDYIPLVVTVEYALGLALMLGSKQGFKRLLWGGLVASMLLTVLLLNSRGALLTVLVITMVQVILFARQLKSLRPFGILAPLVVGLAILILFSGSPQGIVDKVRLSLISHSTDLSFQTRVKSFESASQDILLNPFTGLGYVTRLEDPQSLRRIAYPHNQYLTYAVRGGIFSLLLFLWILFVVLRRLYWVQANPFIPRITTYAIGLFSVFLGVALASNMLQDNFIQPYSGLLLWFLLGVSEYLYLENFSLQQHRLKAEQTPLPST